MELLLWRFDEKLFFCENFAFNMLVWIKLSNCNLFRFPDRKTPWNWNIYLMSIKPHTNNRRVKTVLTLCHATKMLWCLVWSDSGFLKILFRSITLTNFFNQLKLYPLLLHNRLNSTYWEIGPFSLSWDHNCSIYW